MLIKRLNKRLFSDASLIVTKDFVSNGHWAVHKMALDDSLATKFKDAEIAEAVFGVVSRPKANEQIQKLMSPTSGELTSLTRTDLMLDDPLKRLFLGKNGAARWFQEQYVQAFELDTLYADTTGAYRTQAWDDPKDPMFCIMPILCDLPERLLQWMKAEVAKPEE